MEIKGYSSEFEKKEIAFNTTNMDNTYYFLFIAVEYILKISKKLPTYSSNLLVHCLSN